MRELGIDLSATRPRKLTDELARSASVLVSIGVWRDVSVCSGVENFRMGTARSQGAASRRGSINTDEIHGKVKALIQSDCADCVAPITVASRS